MLGDVTIETVLYIAVSGASVTLLWLLGVQPSLRKLRDARQVQKYSSQSRRRSRQSPPTPDMARVREVSRLRLTVDWRKRRKKSRWPDSPVPRHQTSQPWVGLVDAGTTTDVDSTARLLQSGVPA